MADKLAVYNAALAHLGSRRVGSLTEGRASRREIDAAWLPAVRHCLERAPWPSAMRSVFLTSDPGVRPSFGPAYAFAKPDDWLRTIDLASDGEFRCPLTRWVDQDGYWYAGIDGIFVRFVSLDPAYGLDLSRWTQTFADYVAVRLALLTVKQITGSTEERNALLKIEKDARMTARAAEALNTPPVRPPVGSWVRARLSGGMRSDEGGTSTVNLGGGTGTETGGVINVTVDGGEL